MRYFWLSTIEALLEFGLIHDEHDEYGYGYMNTEVDSQRD